MNLRTDVPGGAIDTCVSEKHDAQIEADGRVIENISWAIRQTPQTWTASYSSEQTKQVFEVDLKL